jgi:signal transduction histidine kinase
VSADPVSVAPGGEVAELRAQVASLRLELAQVEATALEAHRRRGGFLATVAHELRNPLMPLRLAAQMLDRARGDDVAHAKLQATITGQVAQMTRLIGDLLEGSRVSTGNFRMERTLIDIAGVLDRATETCQSAMEARGQHFIREGPAQPVLVLGDAARLLQVFGNLLENSSKYTPDKGQITLRAAVSGKTVLVTISDNGIGITPKALPHVFDMFVRDAHAASSHEGLGIGLAVVREIVKAHEGSVMAASAGMGCGSDFVVALPLAVANRLQ